MFSQMHEVLDRLPQLTGGPKATGRHSCYMEISHTIDGQTRELTPHFDQMERSLTSMVLAIDLLRLNCAPTQVLASTVKNSDR